MQKQENRCLILKFSNIKNPYEIKGGNKDE